MSVSPASEKKPRRIILMGRSESGKTTLLQAMHKEELLYSKTQSIITYDDAIDTPGEYIDQSGLWRACIIASCDADIIVLVHSATNDMSRLPLAFNMTFAKPTIGVITKADDPNMDLSIARNFLEMSGVQHIVATSAYTGRGIDELVELIATIDLSDY